MRKAVMRSLLPKTLMPSCNFEAAHTLVGSIAQAENLGKNRTLSFTSATRFRDHSRLSHEF